MKNGNTPAYPTQCPNSSTGKLRGGLTKREAFAMAAPNEIPDWFKVEELPTIKPPKHFSEYKDSPFYNELKSWHNESCFDLPEEVSFYQKEWEEYYKDRNDRDKKQIELRYFKWRVYYADALLSELEKTEEKP